MGLALLELGYNVLGARLDMAAPLLKGNKAPALKLAGEFDALQDVPWAALYKELDQLYPNSKFILTVRNEKDWLYSASSHFKDVHIPLHEWLYSKGVLRGNEELYAVRYRRHYEDVKDYFRGRNDLLIMDFSKGDSWEKLCDFLKEPIPLKSFPYANKGKHNYNFKDKALRFLRKIVPAPIRNARIYLLENMGLHRGRNRFNNEEANRERHLLRKNKK